jgi:hypothetical protein
MEKQGKAIKTPGGSCRQQTHRRPRIDFLQAFNIRLDLHPKQKAAHGGRPFTKRIGFG